MPNEINLNYERLLRRIQSGSINQINSAFLDMIRSLTQTMYANPIHDPEINRALRKEVVRIRKQFTNTYNSILSSYNEKAISLSQRKNLDQINSYIRGLEVKTGLVQEWLGRPNSPVVKIVSGRVWNITKGFYKNLNYVLKSGLLEGKSANDIKIQLTRLLNQPERMDINELRRQGFVRSGGERAYRKLEKEILNYKPGRGIYKSSKKNAYRLARTEINRAYRAQDNDIRQRLPFVIGIEVKLSASHPFFDICDDMQGTYPKDFNFMGWHPNCICYSVPVMATKDQAAKLIANKPVKIARVERIPKRAQNYVEKRAKKFSEKKPWFVDENKKYFEPVIKKKVSG